MRDESFKCYNTYAEIGPRLDPDALPTKTIEGDTKLDESRPARRWNASHLSRTIPQSDFAIFPGAPK